MLDYSFNSDSTLSHCDFEYKLSEITKILTTLPHQRGAISIKILQSFTQPISFFKQISEEQDDQVIKEICQCLRYAFFSTNQMIFTVGEVGEYFYIILEGEVTVYVKNETSETIEEVCKLGPGGSFGELALLRDQPRCATIISSKETHLATLCKSDYLRVLGHISSKKLEETINFFYSLPTFAGWNKRALIKLSYYFRLVKVKRNHVIFSEGDEAESVFIVKKGEMEILKKFGVQRPVARRIGNDGRPLPIIKSSNFLVKAKISLQGVGEIIGDDDVINDCTRSFTCKCYSSTAELLEISKVEFKKRIRSEESLNQLNARQKLKDSHINSTLSILKIIKQPEKPQQLSRESKGKKILSNIRSQNPWHSAQSIFGKNKQNLPVNNAVLLKKAIENISSMRSLPLSPKSPVYLSPTSKSPHILQH